jgi:hypothetical protein
VCTYLRFYFFYVRVGVVTDLRVPLVRVPLAPGELQPRARSSSRGEGASFVADVEHAQRRVRHDGHVALPCGVPFRAPDLLLRLLSRHHGKFISLLTRSGTERRETVFQNLLKMTQELPIQYHPPLDVVVPLRCDTSQLLLL